MPHLGIATGRRPRKIEVDALWPPDWIAMRIQAPHGQVSLVDIHTHHRAVGTNIVSRTWALRVSDKSAAGMPRQR